jgi:hypothetical protein
VRQRLLDVRDHEPPQPLVRALAALHDLAADEYLLMRHRREPLPLYDMLPAMGFRHRTRQTHDGQFDVVIWRATDPEPADAP